MYSLIKKYEGLRLQAYKCPRGYWTIGYGATRYPNGEFVKMGDEITESYAEAMMIDYVIRNIEPIFDKIPYKLKLNQKRALISLIYNCGATSFLRSKLFKAICSKDYAEICRQWDFGFKNNLKGLFKRRTEELFLFMNEI